MDVSALLQNDKVNFAALGQALGMDARALQGLLQNISNHVADQVPAVEFAEEESVVEQTVNVENDTITFVKSVRGNDKAVHRGFLFQQQRKNRDGSKQEWQCENNKQRNGGCKARLQTLVASNVLSKFTPHDAAHPHNHALDPMAVHISNIKSNLKRRAVETREKPRELLNHELQAAPLAVGLSLSNSAIRKQVRRVRIKNAI